MEKSESIAKLADALCKFQSQVDSIGKDGKNPFFKSKYATLDNIIKTVRGPMVKHGLSFSQMPSEENCLVTVLMHSSGEYMASTVKMTPKDNTPQGQGSAITYMRRYALSALLGIATDEDDDGNAASKKREVYDNSPVPDDVVPVVTYDDHEIEKQEIHTSTGSLASSAIKKPSFMEPPKTVKEPTINQIKKKIQELCDSICIVELAGKKEYKDWITQMTGLDVEEATRDNLTLIAERLSAYLPKK